MLYPKSGFKAHALQLKFKEHTVSEPCGRGTCNRCWTKTPHQSNKEVFLLCVRCAKEGRLAISDCLMNGGNLMKHARHHGVAGKHTDDRKAFMELVLLGENKYKFALAWAVFPKAAYDQVFQKQAIRKQKQLMID